jgi:hypothetical protein
MSSASQMGLRLVYENSKTLVNQLGYDTSHAVATQSYLRSEVLLTTSAATYNMPILQNQNASNTNVRLKLLALQDLFVVSEVSLLLVSGAASNGAAPFYEYPDPTVFTTGYAQLLNVYNGNISIIANNQQILPAWDCLKHYFVPQTQKGVGITAQTVFPINQVDASFDTTYPVEPNIVINGAANYQINLNLPAAPTTLDSNTYVAAIFRGILLQNCSSIK